ncbi:hypothetical protein BC834DRAFT_971176 [Gloeopeniophorella convolvens]|nr:hypothetical protein BC834DRAFT_971176 [Gloeopeniophorella convolvens]
MTVYDILGFVLSVIGVCGFAFGFSYITPYRQISSIKRQLDDARILLNGAIETGAILNVNIFLVEFESFDDQLAELRAESNRALTMDGQFKLLFRGRTCKLLKLSQRISRVTSRIELAVDEHFLGIFAVEDDGEGSEIGPVDASHSPSNVADPTYPPPTFNL